MPFFQQVFPVEFVGSLNLGDRVHQPRFSVPANAGRKIDSVASFTDGPYNLSGADPESNAVNVLDIMFAINNTGNWTKISVDITAGAASTSAVTVFEVVNALNANTLFSERFTASVINKSRVLITQKAPQDKLNFYIANGKAEYVLRFNQKAGVAQLPTYFSRHTIANRLAFNDSVGLLIELDASNAVDANVINTAVDANGRLLNYSHSNVAEDYVLLAGQSTLFKFTSGPSENAISSTTTVIEYNSGARKGDLAKKTITNYDSSGDIVSKFELPYTLTESDLITPS